MRELSARPHHGGPLRLPDVCPILTLIRRIIVKAAALHGRAPPAAYWCGLNSTPPLPPRPQTLAAASSASATRPRASASKAAALHGRAPPAAYWCSLNPPAPRRPSRPIPRFAFAPRGASAPAFLLQSVRLRLRRRETSRRQPAPPHQTASNAAYSSSRFWWLPRAIIWASDPNVVQCGAYHRHRCCRAAFYRVPGSTRRSPPAPRRRAASMRSGSHSQRSFRFVG